jgi:amino acid adenylation domain-containing protein
MTFLDLFERTVQIFGNTCALSDDCDSWNYREVNDLADNLSVRLNALTQLNDVVAVVMEPSALAVIAVMGVLKSGCTFLPIDTAVPVKRKKFMLEDSSAKVLITTSELMSGLEGFRGQAILIDREGLVRNSTSAEGERRNCIAQSDSDPCYLIYTSGSSGTPKGVLVSHANIVNYVLWANQYYFSNASGFSMPLFTSLSFDLTLTSILTTLLRGDTLFVFRGEIQKILTQIFNSERPIKAVKLTPAHLSILSGLALVESRVDVVIVGGEQLLPVQAQTLFDLNKDINIYNEYGPTETTVGSTVAKIEDANDITIGVPIANTRIYIVSDSNKRQPIGMPGELCISGKGVSLGYINSTALTDEKFRRNTYEDKEGHERLYKTGDLASWRRDGRIKLHGRIDSQVKVRGYRVEPEEIEKKILEFNEIESASVLPYNRMGQTTTLIAFITLRASKRGFQEQEEARSRITTYLREELPSYMVPSEIMFLEQICLNENGKIDRKELICAYEAYERQQRQKENVIFTATEHKIKRIWEEILGTANGGLDDDFFQVGGHSLAAIALALKIGELFNASIEIQTVFENPTIRQVSQVVDGLRGNAGNSQLTPIEEQDHYPVSQSQKRLWITDQRGAGSSYNIFNCYEFRGTVDTQKLKSCLTAIVGRHEALRTNFEQLQTGEIRQKISSLEKIGLIFSEVNSDSDEEIQRIIDRENTFSFDLENDCLVRAGLIRKSASHFLFFLNVHHIAFDGWSYNVFIQELLKLYCSLDRQDTLDELSLQYKDFAAHTNARIFEGSLGEYWRNKLSTHTEPLQFGQRFRAQNNQSKGVGYEHTVLSRQLTDSLRDKSVRMGASLFACFHAAAAVVLRKYTNNANILLGVPVEGRNHHQLANQIGFYTNTVGVAATVNDEVTFADLMLTCKNEILESIAHQEYPLGLLIEELAKYAKLPHKDIFQVVLVFQPLQRFETEKLPFEIVPVPVEPVSSKFELILRFRENHDGVNIAVEYDAKLYQPRMAQSLLTDLVEVFPLVSVNERLTAIELLNAISHETQQVPARKETERKQFHLPTTQYWERIREVENPDLFFNKTFNEREEREHCSFEITSASAAELLRASASHYVACKTIFLAAYVYLIKLLANSNQVLLQVDSTHPADQTIPFWVSFPSDITIKEYLQYVNSQLIELKNASGINEYAKAPVYRFHYAERISTTIQPLMQWEEAHIMLGIDNCFTNININFHFPTNLYSSSERQEILDLFKAILALLIGNEHLSLTFRNVGMQTGYLSTNAYAHNPVSVDSSKNAIDDFENCVRLFGDHVAVVHEDRQVTYLELNDRANRLANHLKKIENGGCLVGLHIGRSDLAIVGMLGILKAGKAYVPIDPEYPADRISYILEDSNVSILLHDQHWTEGIKYNGYSIDINSEWPNIETQSTENPNSSIEHVDLAYVIYTSGTTGNPKGVMIEHGNLINLFSDRRLAANERVNFTWSAIHSICFDFSVWEIFGALTAGAKVVLFNNAMVRDPALIVELIQSERINLLSIVPSLFYRLMPEMEKTVVASSPLRLIVFGGEALKPTLLKTWRKHYPQIKLVNMYGITETTVHVTYREIEEGDLQKPESNIGLPLRSHLLQILDDNLQIVVDNVVGELVVGGPCVARGYLNRPELTAERFTFDPCDQSIRLYRSGDVGRRCNTGDIQYVGRRDSQVKVRGYRMELSEIEIELRKHPQVIDAKVLTSATDLHVDLVAFLILRVAVTTPELLHFLKGSLPSYMVPSFFHYVDSFPVTGSGKIDKAKLIELRRTASAVTSPICVDDLDSIASIGKTGQHLGELWKEILGLKSLNADDNFFEIGGHSLSAIQLSAKISNYFIKRVGLRDIFKYPTLRALSAYIDSLNTNSIRTIKPIEEQQYYTLSILQRGMWADQHISRVKWLYNTSSVFDLEGPLDVNHLEKAIIQLVTRHEVLRTKIQNVLGKAFQKICQLNENDFRLTSIELSEEHVEEAISGFVNQEFLTDDWLIRFKLLKISENTNIFIVVIHHLICDAWSQLIWSKELTHLYNSFANGQNSDLAILNVSYKDYSAWQHEYMNSVNFAVDKEYWRHQFTGNIPRLELPLDFARPLLKSNNGKTLHTEISTELLQNLKVISFTRATSVYVVLLAALKSYLSRYTGAKDIILGTTFAGREPDDLQSQIGLYVNILPVRTAMPVIDTSFLDFVTLVRDNHLQAQQHSSYPFGLLVEELNHIDKSRSPLFDVLLEYQNLNIKLKSTSPELDPNAGLQVRPRQLKRSSSKYDVTFFFFETEKEMAFSIEYNSDLFVEQRVQSMCDGFVRYLTAVAENPRSKLSNFPVLSLSEENALLNILASGKTFSSYQENFFHEVFQQVCKDHNSAIALICDERKTTYGELERMTRLHADYLRTRYNIDVVDRIAILGKRSDALVTALLSIIKTGAAFVPVDANLPADKIDYILTQSGAKLLLAESESVPAEVTRRFRGDICFFDQMNPTEGACIPGGTVPTTDQSPAYVIFTSGSTGDSKGVEVTWGNFNNYLQWTNEYYFNNTGGYNFPFYKSLSFDLTLTSIFSTLLRGDTLFIYPAEDVISNLKIITKNRSVNSLKVTPSHISLLEKLRMDTTGFRKVIVGGEALKPSHVLVLQRMNADIDIYNEYGPTETTVGCTAAKVVTPNAITIGNPIHNSSIYILDTHNNLMPVGTYGEICVTGKGVSRGYVNNKELTSEKFIQNPFNQSERMYRTGDIGRWLYDGTIDYKGRLDDQIKFNGYRIEPSEIENTIKKLAGVQEVKVILSLYDTEPFLLAYYTSDDLHDEHIKTFAKEHLPAYMVPAAYSKLNSFPLTKNGKIDTAALPQFNKTTIPPATDVNSKPQGDFEGEIYRLWQKVLRQDSFQTDENFFEIGGNSLLVVELTFLLQSIYPEISVMDIFENPTVTSLSNFIATRTSKKLEKPIPAYVEFNPDYKVAITNPARRKNSYVTYEAIINGRSQSQLKTCAENRKIGLETILISLYAYQLSTVAAIELLTIPYIKEDEEMILVDMNLNGGPVATLFDQVQLSMSKEGNRLQTTSLGANRDKIHPVIYDATSNDYQDLKLDEYFDLILGMDYSGSKGLYVKMTFNKEKLHDHKMKEFLRAYVAAIQNLS